MPDIVIQVDDFTKTISLTSQQAQTFIARVQAASPISQSPNGAGEMEDVYTIKQWIAELLVRKLKALNKRGKHVLAKQQDQQEEGEMFDE